MFVVCTLKEFGLLFCRMVVSNFFEYEGTFLLLKKRNLSTIKVAGSLVSTNWENL